MNDTMRNQWEAMLHRAVQRMHERSVAIDQMVQQAEQPRDPHLEAAAQALGISYLEAQLRLERRDKKIVRARTLAKHLNMGRAGGLSAEAFRRQLKETGRPKFDENIGDPENPLLGDSIHSEEVSHGEYVSALNSVFQAESALKKWNSVMLKFYSVWGATAPSEKRAETCPDCKGSGTVILLTTADRCPRCNGKGAV